jgi:hypothetical protein
MVFVVLTSTLSSMFLIIFFQPAAQNIREGTFSPVEQKENHEFFTDSPATLDFIEIVSSLIFLLGLLGSIELLFLWVPSLTDLTESKGKMVWLRKGLFFPERVLSLEVDAKIIIRRKQSSFLGWIMREFLMEIYLSPEQRYIKQVTDFTGIEKIINTPSAIILVKTVKIEQIPLQLIQIRSILSLMKQSPINTKSIG